MVVQVCGVARLVHQELLFVHSEELYYGNLHCPSFRLQVSFTQHAESPRRHATTPTGPFTRLH